MWPDARRPGDGGSRTIHHVGSADHRDAGDDRSGPDGSRSLEADPGVDDAHVGSQGPDLSSAGGEHHYRQRRGLSDDRSHAFGGQRHHRRSCRL